MPSDDPTDDGTVIMEFTCPECGATQTQHPPEPGEQLRCMECDWAEQVEAVLPPTPQPTPPDPPLTKMWTNGMVVGGGFALLAVLLLGGTVPDAVAVSYGGVVILVALLAVVMEWL